MYFSHLILYFLMLHEYSIYVLNDEYTLNDETEEFTKCCVCLGEPLMTASGRNLIRGEVSRKGVISPVGSYDH